MGLFWSDDEKRVSKVVRAQPPIPANGWAPPREFPNLSTTRVLAIDTETFDPDLLTHGPGWARGRGHVVGVSVATDDRAWYFPVRHTVQPELNLDASNTFAWLRDTLARSSLSVVGANLIYDCGWLAEENVWIAGALADVQFAEALLTENENTDLETLAQKYTGRGKESPALYEWLACAYGGEPNGKQRANLYRAPVAMAGPYAEADAALPLQILPRQYVDIHAQGLSTVFGVENGLIKLLVKMRRAGVTVDLERAAKVRDSLLSIQRERERELRAVVGWDVNYNAPASCAKLFDQLGIRYPRTAAGQPSFKGEFLKTIDDPIGLQVIELRKLYKLRTTFIESYVLGAHVNGKVHASFHPMRGAEGGARSGRFSGSHPNLQNAPSRDEEIAPMIRGIFVPDSGHKQWRRYDYSQIEFRFLAHDAVGEGSDDVRLLYNNDPLIDYHDGTIALVKEKTGFVLPRKPAKNVNFGLAYGMGKAKLTRQIGLTERQADDLFAAYHAAMPFVRATMQHYMDMAQNTGIVSTILGRRSRFDLWTPAGFGEHGMPVPLEWAVDRWPGQVLQRAGTHKGLNRRLQGSAADMMKVAMYKCERDGLFDATGVPRLTVHDELDFSDTGESDEAFNEIRRTMETAIQLRVPVVCPDGTGDDWGACK